MRHGSIESLYMSAYPAFALVTAMRLDVFSAIAQGPGDASSIAARLRVAPGRLAPLLEALHVAGLLERDAHGYRNGPEAARSLVRGQPDFDEGLADLYFDRYRAAMSADVSIREDRPAARKDFAAMDDGQARAFFGGMFRRAENAGRQLAQRFALGECRTLVDVGGGTGGLAMGMCRVLPQLEASVAELPAVIPIGRETIAREAAGDAALAARIRFVPADVLAGPLAGAYDVAVVRAVLQVMSPDDAATALVNACKAVRPGGTVYVIGRMVDDSGLAPEESVYFNLVFLSLYPAGRSYREAQYRHWCAQAGLVDVQRIALPGGHSIVVGRKPGES